MFQEGSKIRTTLLLTLANLGGASNAKTKSLGGKPARYFQFYANILNQAG